MNLSKKVQALAPSATLAAAAKAKALKAQGIDVLSLTVGEPDFATPENIQKAAIAAIQSGKASYYTQSAGIPELRQAVVDYMQKNYGLTYNVNQTIITDGAKFALYLLFQTILDEADEVIIPLPYWVSYSEQVKLAGGVPVFATSDEEDSFKVSVADLEKVRSAKTKAIIINSPSNPTGMIYSPEELQAIGQWAVDNQILIVADDIYGRLIYGEHTFTSIAMLGEAIKDNTIVINGVSKTYAMTGWRIGFAVGKEEIIQGMIKIASQSTSNPTAVSQYAALEALTGDQSSVEAMRKVFEERLNRLYPLLKEIPGFKVQKPQACFYFFVNVSETLKLCGYQEASSFVEDLLNEAHVALVTGAGFGMDQYVRISYATDWETIEKSVQRIKAFVERKAQ
ncbi:pyridoxal phosphate-dependent aminotransferase [Enterococcus columbae]|uniref:Aminotransferase n=1 Tax=Enterococcus columbae DSM 7374 = ATCC 51263 TaxID=1121865 RepID=S0KH88_9ENTE|nr:pyridoxal phosphate-dependent aminotransferase [Enterococcus columbae]EOT44199.1 aspartate aminotransferase [Enterococcus columbae DSM 7374 = ATCC 51263]EOW84357.1 aspartate aminotransferase [Enterococcus columbae DSM 7374 = ATCC 51263]